MPPRAQRAAVHLAAAQALAAQDRPARAEHELWLAVREAVQIRDEPTLETAVQLAAVLAEGVTGRKHADAHVLLRYAEMCLADLREGGGQRRTLLRRRRAVKTCPDCAESVLADARVCRFCGYRFAPAPDAPDR